MSNGKQNGFIRQAGLLAGAGFISRIIGLLYVSPVTIIIGGVGLGYYSSAYSYYTIILLISSYSIPSAISKVIAQKLSLKEYRNAHRIFMCSLYYVLAVGLIASLFLYACAGFFMDDPAAIPVLRVFAPTISLYGILGVLRGYFQAHKSMIQTSVSQILEQIVNAVVSIVAAYAFVRIAQKAYEQGGADNTAVYGAMGSALGTGAGVLAALLFMFGIYMLNRDYFRKRMYRDQSGKLDSYREIGGMIAGVVLPFILSTAAYNLSTALNTKLYTSIMIGYRNVEATLVSERYGIFNGEAVKISNIPIAFASAMAAAIIPTIAQAVAAREYEDAKEKIYSAVKTIMILSIPSAVGLFVLAKPVTGLLFPKDNLDYAAGVLMALSLSVVFYALSTLSNSILQGMGKVNTPIIHAVIALVAQTVILVPMLLWTDLDLYALAIASTVYSGVICVLNQLAVRKALGYRQEVFTTFVVPALASVFMGAAAWGVYEGLYLLTESNIISVIPAIFVAVLVYFILLILFKGINEEELRGMPKGYLLVRAAKKMRLMR